MSLPEAHHAPTHAAPYRWQRPLRPLLAAMALALLPLAAACTLTPVHGTASSQQQLALAYAEPASRLEQVFYQTLSARLGKATGAGAPTLSASIAISSSRVGLSTVSSPVTDYQIVARASYRITRDGEVIHSGTRTATAGYQTTGQLVADDAARADAEDRAVRALAETVRLALSAETLAP